MWITSSEVKSNIADGQGGGVYNGFGTVTLGNGTSVTGNEAANPPLEGGSGGGIFNDGGTVTRETGSSVTPNTPDDCIDSGGGCGCPSGNVCT